MGIFKSKFDPQKEIENISSNISKEINDLRTFTSAFYPEGVRNATDSIIKKLEERQKNVEEEWKKATNKKEMKELKEEMEKLKEEIQEEINSERKKLAPVIYNQLRFDQHMSEKDYRDMSVKISTRIWKYDPAFLSTMSMAGILEQIIFVPPIRNMLPPGYEVRPFVFDLYSLDQKGNPIGPAFYVLYDPTSNQLRKLAR